MVSHITYLGLTIDDRNELEKLRVDIKRYREMDNNEGEDHHSDHSILTV